jgi:hypothetical protein
MRDLDWNDLTLNLSEACFYYNHSINDGFRHYEVNFVIVLLYLGGFQRK